MLRLRALHFSYMVPSVVLLACGGSNAAPSEPEPAPVEVAVAPAEPVPPEPAPEPTAPEPAPEPVEAGGGRLAFVTCESPRKTMCTKEYKPVCAEVDTGIRCIKAPCPSSEKKTYSTGCTACADEKVIGYFPAACDALTTSKAP